MIFSKLIKSKRGIAIENAIVFMIVIFTLCALLTSLSLLGHYQTRIEKTSLLRDVEIEQIGEDYLASVRSGTNLSEEYENYVYEVSGDTLTVYADEDKTTTVLYVEASLENGEVNVRVWRYSLPEDTE